MRVDFFVFVFLICVCVLHISFWVIDEAVSRSGQQARDWSSGASYRQINMSMVTQYRFLYFPLLKKCCLLQVGLLWTQQLLVGKTAPSVLAVNCCLVWSDVSLILIGLDVLAQQWCLHFLSVWCPPNPPKVSQLLYSPLLLALDIQLVHFVIKLCLFSPSFSI